MKILMIGSDQVWSFERTFYKYLGALETKIELFPAQNHFYTYYNRSILNKIIYRAGLSRIIPAINRRLRAAVTASRPDAVLVFKGMEILPETLAWMKAQGILIANYNPDNPFIFSGYGSGNANVTRSISLYDLHFTYNLAVLARLEKEFGMKTVFLPFGFDVSREVYEACLQQEEVGRLCFLGNPDAERAAVIKGLLEKGAAIDVYGHGWEKFAGHQNLRIFTAVYGDEFWKTLYRYRVQLNLMRAHNEQSHNMRSFEIPGIGGIQLAPDTPEHRMFFEPGQEIFLFRSVDECAEQVRRLIDLPAAEAMEIRRRARKRSLDSGYSYRDRAQTVLHSIQQFQQESLKGRTVHATM